MRKIERNDECLKNKTKNDYFVSFLVLRVVKAGDFVPGQDHLDVIGRTGQADGSLSPQAKIVRHIVLTRCASGITRFANVFLKIPCCYSKNISTDGTGGNTLYFAVSRICVFEVFALDRAP